MRRLFGRGSAGDSPQQPSPSPLPPQSSVPSSFNIAAGPARPIRFVYCDEKGKFQIDPEALAILQLVKEPVGIVSVCGRARQGKSFILNQLSVIVRFCMRVRVECIARVFACQRCSFG
ncbi:hypothetical protein HAX54_039062 [Datura stramonium]|uniref:GB1/RHD3-type G domain-containing protein n=1 Tax=Datura stramonium TaxID=4076 RepID=A0ABS8VN16_DATST|nr:hypothetical protein [Datura stramonium]